MWRVGVEVWGVGMKVWGVGGGVGGGGKCGGEKPSKSAEEIKGREGGSSEKGRFASVTKSLPPA